MIEVHIFESVVMTVAGDTSVSVFPDGVINLMYRRTLDTPEYRAVVEWTGYPPDQWRRYNVHHDIAHHYVAELLDQPYSYALHDGDGAVPLCDASQVIKDEEHLVGRLHRYAMTGEADDYGILEATFGDRLDEVAMTLLRLLL